MTSNGCLYVPVCVAGVIKEGEGESDGFAVDLSLNLAKKITSGTQGKASLDWLCASLSFSE